MKSATDAVQDTVMRSRLEALTDTIVINACRQQGPRAVLATRRCAAIHEAGHAIVYHRTVSEGFPPPHRLTIQKMTTPLGPTWLGFLHVAPGTPELDCNIETYPDRAWIHAIRTVAGVTAEILHEGADMRLGSSADEVSLAQYIASGLATPKHPFWLVFMDMMDTAAGMLKADEKVLLRIAARLERDRKIGTADLRRMLP